MILNAVVFHFPIRLPCISNLPFASLITVCVPLTFTGAGAPTATPATTSAPTMQAPIARWIRVPVIVLLLVERPFAAVEQHSGRVRLRTAEHSLETGWTRLTLLLASFA